MNKHLVQRGDIWLAELAVRDGDVIFGTRPVVVVSQDALNRHARIVTVVPVTSAAKRPLPWHTPLSGHGLRLPSVALAEQITTISQDRLLCRLGTLAGAPELRAIEAALRRQTRVA